MRRGALDEAQHALELVDVVDRGHERLAAGPLLESRRRGGGLLPDRSHEVVVDPGRHDHARGRRAVLAGVEVARNGEPLGGGLDIGIVEDHDRGLATELEVHALDVAGCLASDLHAGADGAGDGHHLRGGMGYERASGVTVAGDDIEDTRGQQARVGDELCHADSCHGRGVRRLEHDRVARRNRRGELPDRHHHGVVPRSDLADDADGLASDDRGEPLHVLACCASLEDARGAGEEADLVDHGRDLLRHGHRNGLAGVLALERHQLLAVLLEEISDPEESLLSFRGGRVPPLLEGRRRDRVCAIHVLRSRQRGGGEDRARGGIDEVLRLPTHGGHALAPDHVVQHPLVAHSASFASGDRSPRPISRATVAPTPNPASSPPFRQRNPMV